MMVSTKSLVLTAAFLISVGSSGSVQAQEFMTQKELLATIPGSTISAISNSDGKTRWIQNYGKGRKKGKIAGLYGKEQYKAKWSVKGNQWCEDWGSGSACWSVERVGEKNLRMYVDGKPLKNMWKLK